MMMYVIYRHPRDYPDAFVVRRWIIKPAVLLPDERPWIVSASIKDARASLPYGLVKIDPMFEDDPAIAEVWV